MFDGESIIAGARHALTRSTISVFRAAIAYLRTFVSGTETKARQFAVEWVAFWMVFLILALPGVVVVGALTVTPGQAGQGYATSVLFISLTGFVSLVSLELLRVLAWLRKAVIRFWDAHTPPYRSGQTESETTIEASLDEIQARTFRQVHLSILGFILVFLLTNYVDVHVLATDGAGVVGAYASTGTELLTELFPPLGIAMAVADPLLPKDQRTAVFYVMLFGGGAIPFAFPIRNAVAGIKIWFRNEWVEHRPTYPPAVDQATLVLIILLVGLGLPLWFLRFVSRL